MNLGWKNVKNAENIMTIASAMTVVMRIAKIGKRL